MLYYFFLFLKTVQDFPGDPVVENQPSKEIIKNLPSNAGDMGSIPGQGTKIPHTAGQLSSTAATGEACMLQQRLNRVIIK